MATKDRLLSDEELKQRIEVIGETSKGWDVAAMGLLDLINTQKRLYAESVIGEDDKLPNNPLGLAPTVYEKRLQRNELRAEQRKRVNDE